MIEINNLTGHPLACLAVDKKFFTGVAKIVLKGETRVREKISLAFVNKEEIKKLNKKFRGKNKPTDVLSFGSIPNSKFQIPNSDYLGEIVICPEIVKENGEKLARVLIHGILHLLGYEHEKNKKQAKLMEEREKKYLSAIIKNFNER